MKNNPLQYRAYIVIFKINLRSLLRKADFWLGNLYNFYSLFVTTF